MKELGRARLTAAVASRWMLALAVAGSALAVGAVHTVTLCIVTVVLIMAAVLAWWGAEPMRVRTPAMVLIYTAIGLTAYTALQCVPMPLTWLAVIAPHNADVWSRALTPLHEPGPSWAPMSLDPTATRVEVLKGVAYVLAFVAALRVARTRVGVGFLSTVVIATGLALSAAALLHPAFGATRLFGIYDPGPGIWERHVAPLLNPNNLAGYINIATCLALAATLDREPRVPRLLLGTFVVLFVAVQVWIASRSGVIGLVLGVVVLVVTRRVGKWTNPRGAAALSLATGGIAVAGVVLIVLAGSDAPIELFDRDTSKLKLFQHVMRMLPSVWGLGCGRGAFESAFPAFRVDPGYITFAYPENVVAQWTLEWGVPVGTAGLLAIAFALRPGAVIARSALASGAWAGCAAILVQNFGDLGTEVPGLVLAGIVCVAIVVGGTPGHRPQRPAAALPAEKAIPAFSVLAGLPAITIAAVGISGELHRDQTALLRSATVERVTAERMHALTRSAMLRHPAEPYLPFVAALRATSVRDDNPMPWIAAALERANVYAPAHLILAGVLAPRSPAQARLEYRLAVSQEPKLLPTVAGEVAPLIHSFGDATEVVPEGALGAAMLERVVARLEDRLPATSARLDEEIRSRVPVAPGPIERAALRAVMDLEMGRAAPWCDGQQREACFHLAMEKSRALQSVEPQRCAGFELEARARVASNDPAGVSELLSNADRVEDRVVCLETAAKLAVAVRDDAHADEALSRVMRAGCSSEAECVKNLAWVAGEEEARGNIGRARALYERAYARAPEQEVLLADAARLAAKQGLHAEAAADYDKLARAHPSDGQHWQEAAQRERESAAGDLLPE